MGIRDRFKKYLPREIYNPISKFTEDTEQFIDDIPDFIDEDIVDQAGEALEEQILDPAGEFLGEEIARPTR